MLLTRRFTEADSQSNGIRGALAWGLVAAWLIGVFSFLRNYSLIPVLGMLCCLYLMIEIPAKSWMVFFGWIALGLAVYFMYGYRKTNLVGS